MSGRESAETEIPARESTEPRLCGAQEGLCRLFLQGAMYEEQVGPNDQETPEAGGVGPDAGSESVR